MTIENAIEFLRFNNLPYWRVEKNSKLAFKSMDDEEEASGKKEKSLEESIQHFQTNIDLYGPGHYVLIGRPKKQAVAGEQRFYFSKITESSRDPGPANIGSLGTIGELESRLNQTFEARIQAIQEKYEREKEQFKHQQELKALKEEIKELSQKPTDWNSALDKIGGIFSQYTQLMALQKGLPISGVSIAQQRPAMKPAQVSPAAGEQSTEQRLEQVLERLHQVTPDLPADLEALARFAENEPAQFQMILAQLKLKQKENGTNPNE